MKAEGGREILPQVRAILAKGIPFMGHLGMLPQHVLEEGGKYHIKGRDDAGRAKLLDDAGARVRLWQDLLVKVPALPDRCRARLQVAKSEAAERDGNLQAAQRLLDEAVALDESPRTRVEYFVVHARLLIAHGDLPLAQAELEEALSLDPNSAAALALLGDLAYRAQEWERARRAYTRLAQLPGATSAVAPQTLAYRRAELAEMVGDHAEAEAAYREVIATDPAHDGAREALAGVRRLVLVQVQVTRQVGHRRRDRCYRCRRRGR